ncbi:MAG: hypothetical protein ACOC8E_04485, partial [Planctomycetota bacterium]
ALGKPGQMLLLVTDYADRPVDEVELALTFPEDAPPKPMVLVDVTSARVVRKKVTAATKALTVELGDRRTRLFYLGPRAKLPEPAGAP